MIDCKQQSVIGAVRVGLSIPLERILNWKLIVGAAFLTIRRLMAIILVNICNTVVVCGNMH